MPDLLAESIKPWSYRNPEKKKKKHSYFLAPNWANKPSVTRQLRRDNWWHCSWSAKLQFSFCTRPTKRQIHWGTQVILRGVCLQKNAHWVQISRAAGGGLRTGSEMFALSCLSTLFTVCCSYLPLGEIMYLNSCTPQWLFTTNICMAQSKV